MKFNIFVVVVYYLVVAILASEDKALGTSLLHDHTTFIPTSQHRCKVFNEKLTIYLNSQSSSLGT